MKIPTSVFALILMLGSTAFAQNTATSAASAPLVHDKFAPGDFKLAEGAQLAQVFVAPEDFKVVQIAGNLFTEDVERVTGHKPALVTDAAKLNAPSVIVGTLGKSPVIDKLVADGKLDAKQLTGQWESFIITTVAKPLPGVDSALVIVGSDRRGTAYGIFEVSQGIGVSPWYWWADVPPSHQDNLYVAAGTHRFGPPSVQFRGIFINDEDWGMNPWASKTFEPEANGLGPKTTALVKGSTPAAEAAASARINTIGPKTYGKMFELLLRLKANTLWPAMHGVSTAFNLVPGNAQTADDYAIVMGASHCEPMLRNNVGEWPRDDQPAYNFVTNPAGVTAYWEERMKSNGKYENLYTIGMRGIHDGPMQGATGEAAVPVLEKIFAVQRDLISKYVNPDPTKVPQIFCPYKEVLDLFLRDLQVPPDVTVVFPDDNFGYLRYLPTPEQVAVRPGGFGIYYHISYLGAPFSYVWLNSTPPALIWEEMSKAYDHGIQKFWMLNVGDLKPGEVGIDFFMQMAWDEKKWNLDTLPQFLTAWAGQQFGPEHAPEIAAVMAEYYRLGFQRKPEHLQWNIAREAVRLSDFSAAELLARSADYKRLAATAEQLMQQLTPAQRDGFYELVAYPVLGAAYTNERFIASELSRKPSAETRDWTAVFNESTTQLAAATVRYNAIGNGKWAGMMYDDPLMRSRPYRMGLMPPPAATPPAVDPTTAVPVAKANSAGPTPGKFLEKDGVVSILAQNFTRKVDKPGAAWKVIPGLGRTGDAVGVFPTTAPSIDLAKIAADAPALEYAFEVSKAGEFTIHYNLIPTQPIVYGEGLRFAVAIDDQAPQLVTITKGTGREVTNPAWSHNVLDNTTTATTQHTLAAPGPHTLKIYMIDPGVLLEKIVVDAGGLRPSYLGPPETRVSAK